MQRKYQIKAKVTFNLKENRRQNAIIELIYCWFIGSI